MQAAQGKFPCSSAAVPAQPTLHSVWEFQQLEVTSVFPPLPQGRSQQLQWGNSGFNHGCESVAPCQWLRPRKGDELWCVPAPLIPPTPGPDLPISSWPSSALFCPPYPHSTLKQRSMELTFFAATCSFCLHLQAIVGLCAMLSQSALWHFLIASKCQHVLFVGRQNCVPSHNIVALDILDWALYCNGIQTF